MSHPSLPEIIDSLEYYYFLAKAGINYDIAYLKSELKSGFKETRKRIANDFYEGAEKTIDFIYDSFESLSKKYQSFVNSFKAYDNHMPFQPVPIHRRTSTYWKQVAFNTTMFAVFLGAAAGFIGGYILPNDNACKAAISIENNAEDTTYKGNPVEVQGAVLFGGYGSNIFTTKNALDDGVLKPGEYSNYWGCIWLR